MEMSLNGVAIGMANILEAWSLTRKAHVQAKPGCFAVEAGSQVPLIVVPRFDTVLFLQVAAPAMDCAWQWM
jgi:hypothetical protein